MGRFNVTPVEEFDTYLQGEACWIKKTLEMCRIYLENPFNRRNYTPVFSWLAVLTNQLSIEYEDTKAAILHRYELKEEAFMGNYQAEIKRISVEHKESEDKLVSENEKKTADALLKSRRGNNERIRDISIKNLDKWQNVQLKHATLAVNAHLEEKASKKTVYFLGQPTTHKQRDECSLAKTLLNLIISGKNGNRYNTNDIDSALLDTYIKSLSSYLVDLAAASQEASTSNASNRYYRQRI